MNEDVCKVGFAANNDRPLRIIGKPRRLKPEFAAMLPKLTLEQMDPKNWVVGYCGLPLDAISEEIK